MRTLINPRHFKWVAVFHRTWLMKRKESSSSLLHHESVNFNWLVSPCHGLWLVEPLLLYTSCCEAVARMPFFYPCDFVHTGTEDTEVMSLCVTRDWSWTVVGSGTEWRWRRPTRHTGVCLTGEFTHSAVVLAKRSNICRLFLLHHHQQLSTWPTWISAFILGKVEWGPQGN